MTGKKYTKEEDDYLKENYEKKSRKEMSRELGRTERSIEKRCLTVLGLRKTQSQLNEQATKNLYSSKMLPSARRKQKSLERNLSARAELKGKVPEEWLKLPATKWQAIINNVQHYFTGQPCSKGHISPTLVSSQCVECRRLNSRRQRNKPGAKEALKERRKRDYADKNKRANAIKATRRWAASERGKEKLKISNANYLRRNYQKVRERLTRRQQVRMETDLAFKLKKNISRRILLALKNQNTTKDQTTKKLVGCSIKNLINHFESLFTDDMNWNNHGKWHIDHIRPCTSFDLSDKEQQDVCFNWRNLQPLDGIKNAVVKRDNYTPLDELAWVERMQALGYEGELFLKYEEGNSY